MKLSLILVSCAVVLACTSESQDEKKNRDDVKVEDTAAEADMTSDEDAANMVYLSDMVDAEGDEQCAKNLAVDPSVKKDKTSRRLEQMANMMFDKLDADNSDSLSREEYLALIDKVPQWKAPQKEIQAIADDIRENIKKKMGEGFDKHAGDDALLSTDELIALLKAHAPKIGKFRSCKFPGKQEHRVKESWASLIQKYDIDGDKALNEAELAAMLKDRVANCKKWKIRDKLFGKRPPMPESEDDPKAKPEESLVDAAAKYAD